MGQLLQAIISPFDPIAYCFNMRLVNAQTLQLEEFHRETEVKYAILSHRWEEEEVSFQEIQSSPLAALQRKKGFAKIQRCCTQAIQDELDYVWIDTCCIDKSSSAELSEAINSMFRWYKAASVCYAFLSDVFSDLDGDALPSTFSKSLWFTRGWTLQELIAPNDVLVYDQQWFLLGTKRNLAPAISQVTGIDEAVLLGKAKISQYSIAQRMSWASKRLTTRVEDIAYCLFGIFDVNMPLIYGEGEKAFLRLQEEIIKTSDDHSIFAWPINDPMHTGLLAPDPSFFTMCGRVKALGSRTGRSAYSMTNRGLSIKLDATPWTVDTYLVALDCVDELLHKSDQPIEKFRMGIFMRRQDEDDQYVRITYAGKTFIQFNNSVWEARNMDRIGVKIRPSQRMELNVRQNVDPESLHYFLKDRVNGFRICSLDLFEFGKDGKEMFTVKCDSWNAKNKIMSMTPGHYGGIGHIDISPQGRKIKLIKLGFDIDYNPVCFVAETKGLQFNSYDPSTSLDIENGLPIDEKAAQLFDIYSRSGYDKFGWSTVSNGSASQLARHTGLWALKGDRIHGLSLRLDNDELVTIKRGEFQGQLIWDFDIRNLRDGLSRSFKPLRRSKDAV